MMVMVSHYRILQRPISFELRPVGQALLKSIYLTRYTFNFLLELVRLTVC